VPPWKPLLNLAGDRGRLQREHRDHRARQMKWVGSGRKRTTSPEAIAPLAQSIRPLERHVHPSRVMMLNTTL
jgi:hypothetical protein